ncbi:MAG: radical SAM-associated putative lipoprotein [Bacteroidales bacterium]|nr:radical SAM-associated putative lipoprotein [Bacteroidales bacterium]
MKQRINKWWTALVGSILSLLGFTSCDDFPIGVRCEYGMPNANYKLLGDVKDSGGKPVKGIRVVFVPRGDTEEQSWENDTLYTDDKGHFELDRARYQWPGDTDKFVYIAEDVDGADNGSFKSTKVTPDVKKVKKGDGSWYDGDYEVSATITLDKDE